MVICPVKGIYNYVWRSTGKCKDFFHSWAKKYLYVVICTSDGKYKNTSDIFYGKTKVRGANHKIRFSQSMFKPLNCRVWLVSPTLCFETNVVERLNSGQISLVVTCTATCTCHHEVTLHRNRWNKSERKRLNTNRKCMFPVINDARGCADYWVLRKGCQASWSGAADTLPREFVRFRSVSARWFTPGR